MAGRERSVNADEQQATGNKEQGLQLSVFSFQFWVGLTTDN
jgi:hypothetical protein